MYAVKNPCSSIFLENKLKNVYKRKTADFFDFRSIFNQKNRVNRKNQFNRFNQGINQTINQNQKLFLSFLRNTIEKKC